MSYYNKYGSTQRADDARFGFVVGLLTAIVVVLLYYVLSN